MGQVPHSLPDMSSADHNDGRTRLDRLDKHLDLPSAHPWVTAFRVVHGVVQHTRSTVAECFNSLGDHPALQLAPANRTLDPAVREHQHLAPFTPRNGSLRADDDRQRNSVPLLDKLLDTLIDLHLRSRNSCQQPHRHGEPTVQSTIGPPLSRLAPPAPPSLGSSATSVPVRVGPPGPAPPTLPS